MKRLATVGYWRSLPMQTRRTLRRRIRRAKRAAA